MQFQSVIGDAAQLAGDHDYQRPVAGIHECVAEITWSAHSVCCAARPHGAGSVEYPEQASPDDAGGIDHRFGAGACRGRMWWQLKQHRWDRDLPDYGNGYQREHLDLCQHNREPDCALIRLLEADPVNSSGSGLQVSSLFHRGATTTPVFGL